MRALIAFVTAILLGLAAGCASADEEAPATTATVTSTLPPPTGSPSVPATPPDLVPVTVTISGGSVEPPPGRVDIRHGQTVRITVTSDEHDELHLHGYELELELLPGEPGTLEFVADQTGLFDVETHHSGLQLFQLAVQ